MAFKSFASDRKDFRGTNTANGTFYRSKMYPSVFYLNKVVYIYISRSRRRFTSLSESMQNAHTGERWTSNWLREQNSFPILRCFFFFLFLLFVCLSLWNAQSIIKYQEITLTGTFYSHCVGCRHSFILFCIWYYIHSWMKYDDAHAHELQLTAFSVHS